QNALISRALGLAQQALQTCSDGSTHPWCPATPASFRARGRTGSNSETDLSIIRQRRGPANRLGFAVQLCYLRFPGVILGVDQPPFPPLLRLVADQLKVGVESWDEYGQREQTRREHLVELQTVFGFQPFTMSHYRQAVQLLTELAMQTDK